MDAGDDRVETIDGLQGTGLARFLAMSRTVYSRDPHACLPVPDSIAASLARHPYGTELQLFLATDAGRDTARVAAILHPTLKDESGRPLGVLGYFEAMDRAGTTCRLLAAAGRWLRERGAVRVVGPMNGDTWHTYRVNAGPFDTPPFLMEPYNPPYYHALWTAAGFKVLESYYSKRVEDIPAVLAQLTRFGERATRHGYTFRPLNPAAFAAELRTIYRLSVAIFRGNFLYTDISESEFLGLYAGVRSLLVPDFVWFAENAAHEPVGFVFAVPDYQRAVAAMRGSRSLLARFRFMLKRSTADAVNIKTLGVLSSCRGAGLGMALMAQAYRAAYAHGWRRVNLCLIREGNPSGGTDAGLGQISRRYHLYEAAE